LAERFRGRGVCGSPASRRIRGVGGRKERCAQCRVLHAHTPSLYVLRTTAIPRSVPDGVDLLCLRTHVEINARKRASGAFAARLLAAGTAWGQAVSKLATLEPARPRAG